VPGFEAIGGDAANPCPATSSHEVERTPRQYADGPGYAERLARLAATGMDMHGEARFCAALLAPGARVLDAGCGTGRVATRLAELGFDCVGVDVDASMLAIARRLADIRWVQADLAELDLPAAGVPGAFDLIVAAGNVIPLVDRLDGPRVLARLARHLRPDGVLVSGFGLDPAHLPPQAVPLDLARYESWCLATGLALLSRHGTWDGDPFDPAGGYAVSVHRRLR
jgi:SAM-dependent methyltransferase